MTFFNTLLFSSLAGISSLIGIIMMVIARPFAKKYSHYFISFAAGVLLTSAFSAIIPEALEIYKGALILVLAGFLAFYLLEHFMMIHSCREVDCKEHPMNSMAVTGLVLHSFIDGIVIGAGFEVSQILGFTAAIAVLLHKFPAGITLMSIMYHSHLRKKDEMLYALLMVLATPIGAVLTSLALGSLGDAIVGSLLAITAGTFIYIAATDLVPEMHSKLNKMNALVFLAGGIFIYLFTFFLA